MSARFAGCACDICTSVRRNTQAAAADEQQGRNLHKRWLLSWEENFYSLIQLSQFHLVNEGVRGGSLPFQEHQAHNHVETWGGGVGVEVFRGGWGHDL